MRNIKKYGLINNLAFRMPGCLRGFSILLFLVFVNLSVFAQNINVKGNVTDGNGEPLIGVSVIVKGNPTLGTITDFDGNFILSVPSGSTLVISYIGMVSKEVKASEKPISVVMKEDSEMLEEVVVVGYGQQKKESVVGAITQTKGEALQRAGGVSNIGAALTGNLPGVITSQSSGMPGEEDPQIVIRGASSWNNSAPLILVDGIERPMSSVDINSVQSISVLKDASATAVYGVKGANGVILITTKRGAEGKAQIDFSYQSTVKIPSKLPNKYDSYDALTLRNTVIERELPIDPTAWSYITPVNIIDKYRNPANLEEAERYPNVDWQDALFKSHAMSHNASLNVSGGTKFVNYFVSADFLNEGDLFKVYDNHRGYTSGYSYNRLNVRSNLDFKLSKTTTLKVNLSGSNGTKNSPWDLSGSSSWAMAQYWAGAYNIAPDVFLPRYSDGSWGYYPNESNVTNSAAKMSTSGAMKSITTRINTDFSLEQDLSFITKGLNVRAMISWDNAFQEIKRGVNDSDEISNKRAQYKWIDPQTGAVYLKNEYDANNKFDFIPDLLWKIENGEVDNNYTLRNLYYQAQINWARTFGKHDITAMGLFSRQENAVGSVIPSYREDWAFRTTYNYADRYFFEYNGAYNGSEKFSSENRFAFFNSGAIGWMISEEKFMSPLKKWLDMMKLRLSYGEIGDDNIGERWLYLTQWNLGGYANIDLTHGTSPYQWYSETKVGNPDIHWETVRKLNFGIDYSFLNGLFAGTVEVFRDKRTDILVNGYERAIPPIFGAQPPTANLGEVHTKGYELELRMNKVFANQLRIWGNFSMTHAENKIIERDDPELAPAYQKQAGFSINQNHSHINGGYLQNFDQIYGSPQHNSNDNMKLPGDYYIVDFNADGVIDDKDSAPYGYSDNPQNSYNASIGMEWKGFSVFLQFYGVNNVTRYVDLVSFDDRMNAVFDQGTWWSKNTPNADVVMPRFTTTPSYYYGTQFYYDGSFIRLKNAEIAYTFNNKVTSKMRIKDLKLFINGNNLWLWTRMPDDRESNFAGSGSNGAYPTMKRINFGLKFSM